VGLEKEFPDISLTVFSYLFIICFSCFPVRQIRSETTLKVLNNVLFLFFSPVLDLMWVPEDSMAQAQL